jgi:hypothetical protein
MNPNLELSINPFTLGSNSNYESKENFDKYKRIKFDQDRNHKHHQRAQWRQESAPDHEKFYKYCWNTKLNCFKNEKLVELMSKMNIDPDSLHPLVKEDFMITARTGFKVD